MWQFDYLKGIAILFVILLHGSWTEGQRLNVLFSFGINLAVPIFMFVSGYMHMRSYEKREITSVADWIKTRFFRQLMQIWIPFAFFYMIELLYMCVAQDLSVSFLGAVKLFFLGGFGPGSYYIPVLVQFIILFPLLWKLVKKNEKWGSIIIIVIQLCLEMTSVWGGIPDSIYRLLLFRHFIFILLGMLFYKHAHVNKYILVSMLIVGMGYIYLITYQNVVPAIFQNWTNTSMPTALWLGGILYFAIRYMRPLPGFMGKLLLEIGRDTYYIFLVQKLFFMVVKPVFHNSNVLNSLLAIVICCGAGVLLRRIQEKIRKTASKGR